MTTMNIKLAIDPGHGMGNAMAGVYDPGAVARVGDVTYAEADIALRYGLTLKQMCEERQIPFFMTRSSSADRAPVGGRATRAANAGCTHFISLHLNDAANLQANGLEVLYRSIAKDKPFADIVQNAILNVAPLRRRDNKQRLDVAVLRFARGPAILIELGFIKYDADRNYLIANESREAICRSILDVVSPTA